MATDEAKIAYKRRKELSEPSFGIIKEQMSFRRFLLRGLNNAKAEAIMVATSFNMRTLYRVWRWQLNKARKVEIDGAFILSCFWSFTRFIFTALSRSSYSMVLAC